MGKYGKSANHIFVFFCANPFCCCFKKCMCWQCDNVSKEKQVWHFVEKTCPCRQESRTTLRGSPAFQTKALEYMKCATKSILQKPLRKCIWKINWNIKVNKTFKRYSFLYSICFHSYTYISNFRYDLNLMVTENQNLWISNFYAENKTFVLTLKQL